MAPPCGVIGLKSSMEHFKIREINTRVVKKIRKPRKSKNKLHTITSVSVNCRKVAGVKMLKLRLPYKVSGGDK